MINFYNLNAAEDFFISLVIFLLISFFALVTPEETSSWRREKNSDDLEKFVLSLILPVTTLRCFKLSNTFCLEYLFPNP